MIATSFLQAVINSRPRRYGAIKIINVNIFGLSAYGLMECLYRVLRRNWRRLIEIVQMSSNVGEKLPMFRER